jgi:hypothetical protein
MKIVLAILFVLGSAPVDNRLPWPENYRQWVWLSSGLGMSYSPAAADREPQFDNVFVDPASYQSFVRNGLWPDGTMLVLEARDSVSHGSINQSGRFQGALRDIEVEAKDRGKWAFYSFGFSTKPASALPATAACYSCHAQNGAVDNTFVQFYPTLFEIARQKGTLRKQ